MAYARKAVEYNIKEICDYLEAKFTQNSVRNCQIMSETRMMLTIKFRPLKVGHLDEWLYPSRFDKKK